MPASTSTTPGTLRRPGDPTRRARRLSAAKSTTTKTKTKCSVTRRVKKVARSHGGGVFGEALRTCSNPVVR
ncbi:unnamed protein product [Ectocarpus sp. 12 AP-2014]